jgi:acid phosphatase
MVLALGTACVNTPTVVPITDQPADTPVPPPSETPGLTETPVPTPTASTTPAATLTPTPTPTLTSTLTVTPVPTPTLSVIPRHIFIIVLENNSLQTVLAVPYFSALAKRGALLTNYHGVTHPSEPNYIAMIAGDTFVSDDGVHNLPQTNLVDLLDRAQVSWKAYLENYPGHCFNGVVSGNSTTGQYARKHNPFISFNDIRTNPQRCSQLVNSDQLAVDIAANQLPSFGFYVPNLKNDGHDTSPTYAATWLSGFLDPKLADPNFMNGMLVVVTFDEDDGTASNLVYTVLLGPMVHANTTDPGLYTHYSLLRTIEDDFGVGTLNRNDTPAVSFAACNFTTGCNP